MSSSRLGSSSQSRRILAQVPAVEVLHRGLQRKVSVNSYQKAFPRFKVCPTQTQTSPNPINSYLNTDPQQARNQLYGLKEENKQMELRNNQLRTRIRREDKLNGIYMKRMGDAYEMPDKLTLEQALQVRLLLEVEELEEELGRRERVYEQMGKELRQRKDGDGRAEDIMVEIYAMITPAGQEQVVLLRKEEELREVLQRGAELREKRHRLQLRAKSVTEQLLFVAKQLQSQNDGNSQRRQLLEESNQSGLYGTTRPKNTDQVEVELARLQKEYHAYELKMQGTADEHIRLKIELLNEIQIFQSKKKKPAIKW